MDGVAAVVAGAAGTAAMVLRLFYSDSAVSRDGQRKE